MNRSLKYIFPTFFACIFATLPVTASQLLSSSSSSLRLEEPSLLTPLNLIEDQELTGQLDFEKSYLKGKYFSAKSVVLPQTDESLILIMVNHLSNIKVPESKDRQRIVLVLGINQITNIMAERGISQAEQEQAFIPFLADLHLAKKGIDVLLIAERGLVTASSQLISFLFCNFLNENNTTKRTSYSFLDDETFTTRDLNAKTKKVKMASAGIQKLPLSTAAAGIDRGPNPYNYLPLPFIKKQKQESPDITALREAAAKAIFLAPSDWSNLQGQLQLVLHRAESIPALWLHQKVALENLIKTLIEKNQPSGFYHMATGTGKSRLIKEIAEAANLAFPDKKAIIVSPRIQITQQIGKSLDKATNIGSGMQKGKKAAADTSNSSGIFNCVAASFVKFFIERAEKHEISMSDISVLIIDECHMVSPSMQIIIDKARKAGILVIGFSATPSNKLENNTQEIFGRAFHTFSRQQGVDANILAPWNTIIVELDQYEGDFISQTAAWVTENQDELFEKRGIIYVDSCDNAELLAAKLRQSIRQNAIAVYHSGNYARDNQKILSDFTNLDSDGPCVLIVIRMLREGFDLPSMGWVLIATEREDPNLNDAEQVLGRVLRKPSHDSDKVAKFYTTNKQIAEHLPTYPADSSTCEADFMDMLDDLADNGKPWF